MSTGETERGKERRRICFREGSVNTEKEGKSVGLKRKRGVMHRENRGKAEVKVIYCKVAAVQTEMIPSPGTKDREVKGPWREHTHHLYRVLSISHSDIKPHVSHCGKNLDICTSYIYPSKRFSVN